MTDQPNTYRIAEAPTVWIDGHPQLEAIAAAVWEHCRTEDTSLVVDDPRNIAVAAFAAVLAVLPPPADRAEWDALCRETDRLRKASAETVDRAAVLREAADVLDTLPADATSFDKAEHKHKGGAAAERLRRIADEAQQPAGGARQPDTETPTAPCSWVAVKSSHTPHTWAPQPGMDPVPCAGYTPPLTDQPTVEPERSAAADTDAAVAPHCDGFPTTCPNPVTVPPAPPHHYGGIRCGCYDEEQPS